MLLAPAGQAQVGHDPDRSPYRDLAMSHALVVSGGYLAGSGGRRGAGPAQGPLLGLRYSIRLGGPMEVVFNGAGGRFRRIVYNPGAPVDTVHQSVAMGDLGFHFILTGQKTWRGLAPYFGGTLGAAFGESVSRDTSGFRFRGRFQFGPQIGLRWYPSRSVSVRIEGRDILWKLRYPASYYSFPVGAPLLVSGVDPDDEWTHNLSLSIGLGIATRF